MHRHIFLIPGFFGFANLGDFAYWGHVYRKLEALLDERGMPARIHCVKSLPTASTVSFDFFESAAVPEPCSSVALLLGSLALLACRRR